MCVFKYYFAQNEHQKPFVLTYWYIVQPLSWGEQAVWHGCLLPPTGVFWQHPFLPWAGPAVEFVSIGISL